MHRRYELWLELAILVMAVIIPFSAAWRVNGYHVPISALWGLAIVVMAITLSFRADSQRRLKEIFIDARNRRLLIAVFVFMAACALSGLAAIDIHLWGKELFQLGLFFCLALSIWLFGARRLSLDAAIGVLLVTAAAASIAGIIQYFWGQSLGVTHFPTEAGRIRAFGGLQYPNKMGVYLAGIISIAVATAVRKDRLGRAAMILSVPIAICLVLTLSRSGCIAALSGMIAVLAIFRRQALQPIMVTLLIMSMAGCVVVLDHRGRKQERKVTSSHVSSIKVVAIRREVDANRMQLLKLGVKSIWEKPVSLGTGLGNAEKVIQPKAEQMSLNVSEKARPDLRSAGSFHNTPIQLFVETGILGLATALLVLYYFLRVLCGAPPEIKLNPAFAGLTGCITAILVSGAFDWLFTRGTGDMMFYAAGFSLALLEKARRENCACA